MGYRSQVVIVTDDEIKWPEDVLAELESLKPVRHFPSGGRKVWHHTYVKWYQDPDYFIDTIHWIKTLPEQDLPWGFIRLGEDDDDTEVLGTPWDFDIFTERKIIGVPE